MQYVNLGKTGLKVSRLCLGMMTYGTPEWRKWVLDEEAARPRRPPAWSPAEGRGVLARRRGWQSVWGVV